MKAVILAGGFGTRLRPLTRAFPKPLLPIGNKPFLEHQLAWLAAHGVDEVVLALGYRSDAFAARFPDGRFGTLRLTYMVEPEPLGTAGALRFAASEAKERLVVCNGDVLTDLDLSELVSFHERRGAEATIALTRVSDPSAFGVVPTGPDGQVLAFVEKPPPGQAPTDWINAGTYVLEPTVLGRIPSGRAVSIERETFPLLLTTPGSLYAMATPAYWLDIGTPEKYLQANVDVLDKGLGGLPGEQVAEGVFAEGPVHLHPEAMLKPPMLLGPHVVVERGAVVDRAVLGAGCVIGAGARVDRSVLLDGSRVGPGALVVDSVLGPWAAVGANATVTEMSIVSAGAQVPAGANLKAARLG